MINNINYQKLDWEWINRQFKFLSHTSLSAFSNLTTSLMSTKSSKRKSSSMIEMCSASIKSNCPTFSLAINAIGYWSSTRIIIMATECSVFFIKNNKKKMTQRNWSKIKKTPNTKPLSSFLQSSCKDLSPHITLQSIEKPSHKVQSKLKTPKR